MHTHTLPAQKPQPAVSIVLFLVFFLASCLPFPFAIHAAQESTAPSPATSDTPPLGTDTVLQRLSNGLTVLIMEDHRFPLVATRLYVHAGSAYESANDAGISHVLEHMVFKGTEKRPKGILSRQIEEAGGYINAATSFDYTVYITDMPKSQWQLGMDVVRDMAFHPTLDATELEAEKQVVLAELKRGEDSPNSVLFQTAHTKALRGTPYAHPIIGFENTIQNITVEAMRAYIKRLYQPQNMLLVVVGDIQAQEVLAEAEQQFAAYANTSQLTVPQPIDAQNLSAGTPQITIKEGPWNKVYFSAVFPAPSFNEYQSITLDMLAQVLGGDDTSMLYRKYKYEQQLVDSISAYNASFERLGMFGISAVLDADKLTSFWDELIRDLAALSETAFTQEELDRARLNLEDGFYTAKETLSGLTSKVGFFQFMGQGEQGEINYIEALQTVDQASLQQALTTWLKPENISYSLLTPKETKNTDALQQSLEATLHAHWPANKKDSKHADAAKEEPSIIDLGQGRTVVVLPDSTLPYVSASLRFSGGDALLSPQEQGLSSLTARVLTTGTKTQDASAINAYLADRAASLGAFSGRTMFGINMQGPSRFSKDLFTLMGEVLVQPSFTEKEVAREITSQIASIHQNEDSPFGLLFRKIPPFLFPGSVYGYEQLGQESYLKNVTPKAVAEYWERQKIRPWVLAVSGDVDKDEVVAFAKNLPVPTHDKVVVLEPTWGSDKALTLPMPNRAQAHLMLIFKTIPETSKDTPALQVLEAVLGGMGGPLFTELRDKQGLGYTVAVLNQQNEDTGYMMFYIGTDPDKLDQAEEAFIKVLTEEAAILQPPKALQRGINQIEGDYYRTHQSLASRSGEAAFLTLTGRPLSYAKDQLQKARQVTPDMLRTLMRTYLAPESAYVVKIIP